MALERRKSQESGARWKEDWRGSQLGIKQEAYFPTEK